MTLIKGKITPDDEMFADFDAEIDFLMKEAKEAPDKLEKVIILGELRGVVRALSYLQGHESENVRFGVRPRIVTKDFGIEE